MHLPAIHPLPLLWLLLAALGAGAGQSSRWRLGMSSDRRTADLPPGLLRKFEELCRVSVSELLPLD